MEAIQPIWLNTILGVILPFFIQWIKGQNLKREINFLIALAVSCIVGLISAYFTNNFIFSIDKIMPTITYIFSITQIVYEFIVKEFEENLNS